MTTNQKRFKKYRKGKKLTSINIIKTSGFLSDRFYSLQALSYGRITKTEINSLKFLLSKKIKKRGCFKICIYPHHPATRKPTEIRMGKGKGNIDTYFARVRPGAIICEIQTSTSSLAKKILSEIQYKISLPTKINL